MSALVLVGIGLFCLVWLFLFSKRWSVIKAVDKEILAMESVIFSDASKSFPDRANRQKTHIRKCLDSNKIATNVIHHHVPSGIAAFTLYMAALEGVLKSDSLFCTKDNLPMFALYWSLVKNGIVDCILQSEFPSKLKDVMLMDMSTKITQYVKEAENRLKQNV